MGVTLTVYNEMSSGLCPIIGGGWEQESSWTFPRLAPMVYQQVYPVTSTHLGLYFIIECNSDSSLARRRFSDHHLYVIILDRAQLASIVIAYSLSYFYSTVDFSVTGAIGTLSQYL